MSDFKVGDWVVVLESDRYFHNCEKGQAQQILPGRWWARSGRDWEEKGWWYLSFKDGSENWYSEIRHATLKEIELRTGIKIKTEIEINNNDYREISMNKITEVLEKVYNNPELRKSIVPLFISNPGMGKTMLINQFAEDKKVHLVELITSQMSPFEISGIAMPDKEIKKMTYYNFDKLENLKDGDILFFDELLNGNPIVLNACLTMLEQRRFISGKELPDIMIVAAANPQGMTPLTPQIKERFVWYQTKFDVKMWQDYMFNKYKLPTTISSKLCGLIKDEDFTANNFNTPRSIDKAVNMLINSVPTPYNATLEPYLNTIIDNKLKQRVKLNEERYLEANEQISWLELVKLKKEYGTVKK